MNKVLYHYIIKYFIKIKNIYIYSSKWEIKEGLAIFVTETLKMLSNYKSVSTIAMYITWGDAE